MKSGKLEEIIALEKKMTFTKSDLEAALNYPQLSFLYEEIKKCEERGVLFPIKSSGTNGNNQYPVFLRYRKKQRFNNEDDIDIRLSKLHPKILKQDYLKNRLSVFKKNEVNITKLSEYLFKNPEVKTAISRKERSFAVFGEEKVLDSNAFCRLLDNIGLGAKELAWYDTPEYCFADYVPHRKKKMQILICENKDIWFDIRRMMFEQDYRRLFNADIDGVIYGQGNRITETGALSEYTKFLQAEQVQYLYWGDLDREGLNIFLRLKEACPQLSICIFNAAYSVMLERAKKIKLPSSEDGRERLPDTRQIFENFTSKQREAAEKIIKDNLRLPQEIISFADLEEFMG